MRDYKLEQWIGHTSQALRRAAHPRTCNQHGPPVLVVGNVAPLSSPLIWRIDPRRSSHFWGYCHTKFRLACYRGVIFTSTNLIQRQPTCKFFYKRSSSVFWPAVEFSPSGPWQIPWCQAGIIRKNSSGVEHLSGQIIDVVTVCEASTIRGSSKTTNKPWLGKKSAYS